MKLHVAILKGAALLVPAAQRAEWFAAWRSELWYVQRNTISFCLGAFQDAFWVRRNQPAPAGRAFHLESPLQCILLLAALAAVSLFFAFRLPLPRSVLLPSPYRDARNLVTLSAGEPSVRVEQYRVLAHRPPYRFTGFAFYLPVRASVQSAELSVALASDNLFELLQIPTGAGPQSGPRLILSREVWRKCFDADPRIAGRIVEVAGRPVVVGGVIPGTAWSLPGKADAWLLVDDAHLAQLPAHMKGFVLGRILAPAPSARRWTLSVPNEEGTYDRFECSTLVQENLLSGYSAITLLSLAIVWAIVPLGLGDYPRHRPAKLRRWMFLGLKLVLLLPIVCCGSLDLASIVAPAFMAHGFLVGNILAVRWALVDQRRRCPVCLRLLTNPTRIGGPSRIFLEWYGTELICTHGHGLLYVPEILTSCYSTQRWQNLDASWSVLFS